MLVIFGGEGISRYRSTDGHLLMEYPTQSYNSGAAVLGDTLLAMSADGKETVLYDLKTGRQTGGSIYDGLSFLTALGLDDEGVYLAMPPASTDRRPEGPYGRSWWTASPPPSRCLR